MTKKELLKALEDAADSMFIAQIDEKGEYNKTYIPDGRSYKNKEVIINAGYSENTIIGTTEDMPELVKYIRNRK